MAIAQFCAGLQDAWISQAIASSTWGYPVVGALHLLAFALIGGALLIPGLRDDGRWILVFGLMLVALTGVLLFAAGATRYCESTSLRIKMALLVLLAALAIGFRRRHPRLHAAISLPLWAAVIFAARGIAFF